MPRKESPELAALRKQAQAGDPDAQYAIGCRYFEGEGVRKDYVEALRWYRLAAARNHNSGLCDVGYCYRNGLGVEQDFAKAVPFYRQAADQGCPTGAYWLACAYHHAQGVRKDLAKAEHWYKIARERGDSDAPQALKELATSRRK